MQSASLELQDLFEQVTPFRVNFESPMTHNMITHTAVPNSFNDNISVESVGIAVVYTFNKDLFASSRVSGSVASDKSFIGGGDQTLVVTNFQHERHDAVLSFFGGVNIFKGKDAKFKETMARGSTLRAAELSPDLICEITNRDNSVVYFVLEVKTSSSDSDVCDEAASAYSKYAMACHSLKSTKVTFKLGVISVGPSVIATNLKLNQDQQRLILGLYHLGSFMNTLAFERGVYTRVNEEFMSEFQMLLGKVDDLSKMRMYPDKLPFMSPKYLYDLYETSQTASKKMKPFFERLYQRAGEEIKRELIEGDDKARVDISKSVSSLYNRWEQFPFKRSPDDRKSPFQIPCVLPKKLASRGRYIQEMFLETLPSNIITIGTMSMAISALRAVLFLEPYLRGCPNDYRKINTSLRHKDGYVHIRLSDEMKRAAENRGVFKRKLTQEPPFEESKGIFPADCFSSDIKKFITEDCSNMLKEKLSWRCINEDAQILSVKARAQEGLFRQELMEEWNLYSSSKLAHSLYILSSIMNTVSCSTQGVYGKKKGSFYVKKVMNHEIYCVIKVTKSSKPCSFAVLVNTEYYEELPLPFRQPVRANGWDFYDFMTIGRERALNYSFMFEKSWGLLSMWCEIYSTPLIDVINEPKEYDDIISSFSMCLMVTLEGKPGLSADLLLVRYMYMNVITASIVRKNPFSISKKLSMRPRSRLHAFCLNRIIENFHAMATSDKEFLPRFATSKSSGSSDEQEDQAARSSDKVINLINWIDGKDLPSFEAALNLSYLGVLHNKDESERIQSAFKMFEKIISVEMDKRKVHEGNMGSEEPSNDDFNKDLPGVFSPSFVTLASQSLVKRMKKNIGATDVKDYVTNRMAEEWGSKTFLDFATFKASTVQTPKKVYDPSSLSSDNVRKCLENVKELMSEPGILGASRPIEVMDILMDKIEKDGVIAALFRKLQLGGVREIFILDMPSRIMINFVETVSRILCEKSDVEMMTKGKEKLKIFQKHFIDVSKKAGVDDIVMHAMNSDDCKTWCQKFVMPVFAHLLGPMLPRNIFNTCCRILNCITNKKLLLPPELLKEFTSREINKRGVQKRVEETMDGPGINEAKSQFLGESDFNDLINPNESVLRNLTNMMQGILHYTSSLLHSAAMSILGDFWTEAINTERGVTIPMSTFILTQVAVSSDDSASIITIINKRNPELPKESFNLGNFKMMLMLLCKMKELIYPWFCAAISKEKSCSSDFSGKIEFNSLFYVGNTMISPLIKFVYTSLSPKPSDRLSSRCDTWGNLRKQIVENGGSHGLAARIQIAQCSIHYTCMGADISDEFSTFTHYMMNVPVPCLGFFCYEPDMICGMYGNKHATHNWLAHSKTAYAFTWLIFDEQGAHVNEYGSLEADFIIHMGARIKHLMFLERNKFSYDTYKQFESSKDPERYFRDPIGFGETFSEIYMKMALPEAANAFVFPTGMRMVQSAVYLLNSACVTRLVRDDVTPEITNASEAKWHFEGKYSLISLILWMVNLAKDTTSLRPEDEDKLFTYLYPSRLRYNSVNEIVHSFKDSIEHPCERRASKLSSFFLDERLTVFDYTMEDACKAKWFGDTNPTISRIKTEDRDEMVSIFQAMAPWFKDTFEESQEYSGLTKPSFANMVKDFSGKKTSQTVLAPITFSTSVEGTIRQLCMNNFSRCGIYLNRISNSIKEKMRVQSQILLSISAPGRTYTGEDGNRNSVSSTLTLLNPYSEELRSSLNENDRALSAICQINALKIMSEEPTFRESLEFKQAVVSAVNIQRPKFYRIFVKPQDMTDQKEPFGEGIISGRILNKPFMAFVTNKTLKILYLDCEESGMKDTIKALTKILTNDKIVEYDELSNKNTNSSLRYFTPYGNEITKKDLSKRIKPRGFTVFSGRTFDSSDRQKIASSLLFTDIRKMRIIAERNTVKVVYENDGCVIMIAYLPTYVDLRKNTEPVDKPMAEAWMSGETLSVESIFNKIFALKKYVEEQRRSRGINLNYADFESTKWMFRTLKYRVNYLVPKVTRNGLSQFAKIEEPELKFSEKSANESGLTVLGEIVHDLMPSKEFFENLDKKPSARDSDDSSEDYDTDEDYDWGSYQDGPRTIDLTSAAAAAAPEEEHAEIKSMLRAAEPFFEEAIKQALKDSEMLETYKESLDYLVTKPMKMHPFWNDLFNKINRFSGNTEGSSVRAAEMLAGETKVSELTLSVWLNSEDDDMRRVGYILDFFNAMKKERMYNNKKKKSEVITISEKDF